VLRGCPGVVNAELCTAAQVQRHVLHTNAVRAAHTHLDGFKGPCRDTEVILRGQVEHGADVDLVRLLLDHGCLELGRVVEAVVPDVDVVYARTAEVCAAEAAQDAYSRRITGRRATLRRGWVIGPCD